jgi:hypothetical protein
MSAQVKMKEIPKTEFQIPTGVKVKMKVIPKDEVKKNLPMRAPKKPIGKGLVVEDLMEIKLSDIKSNIIQITDDDGKVVGYKNVTRPEGLDHDTVEWFESLIKRKQYDKYGNIPPVVIIVETVSPEGDIQIKIYLITGGHRYMAHSVVATEMNELETATMWCAVCKFVEEDGFPAEHWQWNYQSEENDKRNRPPKSNARTDQGIIEIIKEQSKLQKPNGDLCVDLTDEKSIRVVLKQQGIDTKKAQDNLILKIQSDANVPGSVIINDPSDITKSIKDLTGKSDADFKMKFKRGPYFNDLDESYSIRLLERLIKRIRGEIAKGNGIPDSLILLSLTQTLGKDYETVRENIRNLFQIFYLFCKDYVLYYETGILEKSVKLHFENQLESDPGDEKIHEVEVNFNKGGWEPKI